MEADTATCEEISNAEARNQILSLVQNYDYWKETEMMPWAERRSSQDDEHTINDFHRSRRTERDISDRRNPKQARSLRS
jgi:hypothetical protein